MLWRCLRTGVYGAGDPLESLLEINTIRTAPRRWRYIAAAGKITDREQTPLNALLDEFQQALESGVMEKIFGQPRFPLGDLPLRGYANAVCQIEQCVRLGPSLHFLYDTL